MSALQPSATFFFRANTSHQVQKRLAAAAAPDGNLFGAVTA